MGPLGGEVSLVETGSPSLQSDVHGMSLQAELKKRHPPRGRRSTEREDTTHLWLLCAWLHWDKVYHWTCLRCQRSRSHWVETWSRPRCGLSQRETVMSVISWGLGHHPPHQTWSVRLTSMTPAAASALACSRQPDDRGDTTFTSVSLLQSLSWQHRSPLNVSQLQSLPWQHGSPLNVSQLQSLPWQHGSPLNVSQLQSLSWQHGSPLNVSQLQSLSWQHRSPLNVCHSCSHCHGNTDHH